MSQPYEFLPPAFNAGLGPVSQDTTGPPIDYPQKMNITKPPEVGKNILQDSADGPKSAVLTGNTQQQIVFRLDPKEHSQIEEWLGPYVNGKPVVRNRPNLLPDDKSKVHFRTDS
jgi:hypothetical protein